jgi:hypothetical protein
LLCEHRPHDQQRPDDAPEQLASGIAGLRLHARHRPRRHRAVRRQASAHHQGRSGRADRGADRFRSDGPGPLPVAAARRLERPSRRRRRVGNAKRVQRRLRMERLRRAEGVRLCVAEQGHAQLPAHDGRRPVGLSAQPGERRYS